MADDGEKQGGWAGGSSSSTHINALSDDLLARCLALLDDRTLRAIAVTCRRWAALLRERHELWHSVHLELPAKRSRGRDRRNSYTTPCALDILRIRTWLQRRAGVISELSIRLLYPDALGLLPQLLPPLAPALRRLALAGSCKEWPYLVADWRWLAGMGQLQSLELRDALPGMGELLLPPSLTKLHIDRVGEGDVETEGFDDLPACFSRLTALESVTLGTATTYLLQADEKSALKALRAARGLRELRLPDGAVSAVPDVVTRLTELTLLSFRGCDKLGEFGGVCTFRPNPFFPLKSLLQLRYLDFSSCALEQLPPHLGDLPLRTLLLAGNRLTSLPAAYQPHRPPTSPTSIPAAFSPKGRGELNSWAAQASRARAGVGGGGGKEGDVAAELLPGELEALDVSGNAFKHLPLLSLLSLSCLTHLDMSRCWALEPEAHEWRQLLGGLPALRVLRHSCAMLEAEVATADVVAASGAAPPVEGGTAPFADAAGRCCGRSTQVQIERVPAPHSSPTGQASGKGKRARSCTSLEVLEAQAASALLGGERRSGGAGSSSGDQGASSSGSGGRGISELGASGSGSRGGSGSKAGAATLEDLAAASGAAEH